MVFKKNRETKKVAAEVIRKEPPSIVAPISTLLAILKEMEKFRRPR